MPYEYHKNLAPGSSFDEQRIYWLRFLEEKQKNIERSKKYVGDQDVEWWGIFFPHHLTILDNYIAEYWSIHNPFTWNIEVPSMVFKTH